MEQLTLGVCVKKGWISSWHAIKHMPWLFLGACAVFACTSLLATPRPTAAETLDTATRVGHSLLSLLWFMLQLMVSGTLTIKVHRFVLLGEGANPLVPLNGRPLGRYAVIWTAVVVAMMMLAILALVATRTLKLGFVVYVPLLLVYLFVVVRLSLLYPSIALGSKLTLRAAWHDSRGHVLSMLGVGVVTYLPLFVIALVLFFVAGPKSMLAQQHPGSAVAAILQAVLSALFAVLAAASLSWLYRRYARELLPHAQDKPL